MGDTEPIQLHGRRPDLMPGASSTGGGSASVIGSGHGTQSSHAVVAFNRSELSAILAVYGRLMAEGVCRDYALDFGREKAVFSMFRRASEVPLYRVEKAPKLARKQGAFSVVTPTGLILKRGHELTRVLDVLSAKIRVVSGS